MSNTLDMTWQDVAKPIEVEPWEMEWAKDGPNPWESKWDYKPSEGVDPVESVFTELEHFEGSGDNVTNILTGDLGVTESARKAIGGGKGLEDRDVAKIYLTKLHSKWKGLEGYEEAPVEVKGALLDASYNMGESVMKQRKLKKALGNKDYAQAMLELLDTANVGDKSLKGLAVRRAKTYNKSAEKKITEVEMAEDGTLTYRAGEEVVLSYKPKGGKHEKSRSGVVSIPADGVLNN